MFKFVRGVVFGGVGLCGLHFCLMFVVPYVFFIDQLVFIGDDLPFIQYLLDGMGAVDQKKTIHFWQKSLLQSQLQRFPWFKSVKMQFQFPRNLQFYIEVHKPVIRWRGERVRFLNEQGNWMELGENIHVWEQKFLSEGVIDVRAPISNRPLVMKLYHAFQRSEFPLHLKSVDYHDISGWHLEFLEGHVLVLGLEKVFERVDLFQRYFMQMHGADESQKIRFDFRHPQGMSFSSL